MVYKMDDMLYVDINTSSQRRSQFNQEVNDAGLKCTVDLIDEAKDVSCIREFAIKQRVSRRYNSNVIPIEMHKGDLVLRQVVMYAQQGKLQSN